MSSENNDKKLNEEFFSKQIYCGQAFKTFIIDKYSISDKKIYSNHNILLLIYAYEWFNYKDNYQKMKFHPYLRIKDNNILEDYRNKEFYRFSSVSGISTIGFYYYLKNKYIKNNTHDFLRRLKSVFYSSFLGSSMFICFYFLYYRRNVNNFINKEYNSYLELNIDKDLIKNEVNKISEIIKDKKQALDGFGNDGIDMFIKSAFKLNSPNEIMNQVKNNDFTGDININREINNTIIVKPINNKEIKLG